MPATTPLVLLHGFPMTGDIWRDVAAATDLPGFTLGSPAAPSATIDGMADAVHRTIQTFGRPCVVGGLSMGGYVALSIAERYPDDLAGLVLLDTKATADDAAATAKRDEMIAAAQAGGSAAIARAMRDTLLSPAASPEVRARFDRMAEGIAVQTLIAALSALRDRPGRTAVLGRIKVPTLCVVGADDAATPPAVVEDMRRQIPTARPLAVIPGAGHIPPMENPAATAAVLQSFLRDL